MSKEIPQELIDTGLEWTPTGNSGQYRACDGEYRLLGYVRDPETRSVHIQQYHDVGWTEALTSRPTVAAALAVARRMIEAANG